MILHGEQSLEVIKALPTEGEFTLSGQLVGVWDKGALCRFCFTDGALMETKARVPSSRMRALCLTRTAAPSSSLYALVCHCSRFHLVHLSLEKRHVCARPRRLWRREAAQAARVQPAGPPRRQGRRVQDQRWPGHALPSLGRLQPPPRRSRHRHKGSKQARS